jgi:succinate dehydrogenase / fumarate reductase flavoprotein subunit
MIVSEAIARCAIERKESRGAHFREDYMEKSDTFAKFSHVVRRGKDGSMELDKKPVPELPDHLKQVIEENK